METVYCLLLQVKQELINWVVCLLTGGHCPIAFDKESCSSLWSVSDLAISHGNFLCLMDASRRFSRDSTRREAFDQEASEEAKRK